MALDVSGCSESEVMSGLGGEAIVLVIPADTGETQDDTGLGLPGSRRQEG